MADYNPEDTIIKIPYNKQNTSTLLLIAIGFGLAGFWFVKEPASIANSGSYHKFVFEIVIIGVICMTASILGCIVFLRQLINKNPGLIIDDNGVTFYPGTFGNNFIAWSDIEKFYVKEIAQSLYISIYLVDPVNFIKRQRNAWKRKVMSLAYKKNEALMNYGTDNLKCNFDKLLELLNSRLTEYKRAEKITNFKG
jgi:hypothetical protein